MAEFVKGNIGKEYFGALKDFIFSKRKPNEHIVLNLTGEDTQYCRFNDGKIRQNGFVMDYELAIRLVQKDSSGKLRQATNTFSLSTKLEQDKERASTALRTLQGYVETLPVDPFASVFLSSATSESIKRGPLLEPALAIEKICQSKFSPTGLYTSGTMTRANAGSGGAFHWFSTNSYLIDYSLYGSQERAYKGFYGGGQSWDEEAYLQEFTTAEQKLRILEKPLRTLKRGEYRVYLAPAAVWEIFGMLSRLFSESSIRQGGSPLRLVQNGEQCFSPKFSFLEDFQYGDSPAFTGEGDLAQEKTQFIDKGALKETLVSKRTGKEYGLKANGASLGEHVRAGVVSPGNLLEENALSRLGTGIYISNLHYLNWSDSVKGRLTGTTRYACFWVENGEIVAPIENLRWDDTIFRLFGSELEEFTSKPLVFFNTCSYYFRSAGAFRCPGMLLKSMTFTL